MIDLLSLIEQTAGWNPIGQANNRLNGTEYWGACIFCGTGRDRFHVYPYAPKPHYWCRVCEKTGDHIDILRHFKNLSYVESCAELGISPGETVRHEASMFFDDQPPCKAWQDFAQQLIEQAEKYLRSSKARHALDYLRGRGLKDETIEAAHLGYVPLEKDDRWYTRSFSDWGLTDEMLTEKQREKGCVRVPNGILIPWSADGHIWKIAIKRFEASGNEPKYGQVVGSRESLYGTDSLVRGKPVMLLEGEFDKLSVEQEAGDLIVPIGTGSAKKGQLPLWIARIFSHASTVLVGFDNDENHAGDDGANYWLETFSAAMRLAPLSHDANQMLQDKKPIRLWVEMGLNVATMPQQPLQEQQENQQPGSGRTENVQSEAAPIYTPAEDEFFVNPTVSQPSKERIALFQSRPCASCGSTAYSMREDGRLVCPCYFVKLEANRRFQKGKVYA